MPSKGNLRPRIQEVSHDGNYAILNSLGLPTKGVKKFLPQINNKKLTKFNRPIGISIGGNSFEEYLSVFSEIDHHSDIYHLQYLDSLYLFHKKIDKNL